MRCFLSPPAARERKPPAIVIVNAERLFGTVVSGTTLFITHTSADL